MLIQFSCLNSIISIKQYIPIYIEFNKDGRSFHTHVQKDICIVPDVNID